MKKSLTPHLLIGFAVTLLAVLFYSWFTLRQMSTLRALQSNIVERNRRDSLQLLRVQDSLNSLGFAVHDILESPYSISDFEAQFRGLSLRLSDATKREREWSPMPGDNRDELVLEQLHKRFDDAARETFRQARANNQKEAVRLIMTALRPLRFAMAAEVSHMLNHNGELDQLAEEKIARIYDRVEKDLYTFLLATVIAISLTGVALVYSNRRIFRALDTVSNQKSVLARKLISVQEEVLRSVSRELHDEFGQIFTAIGAMLSRLERKGIPPGSPVYEDLVEVRGMTQGALDKVRSLSQMLHPAVIDDYGLEKALEWYVPTFERQTGINVKYEKNGSGPVLNDEAAIHVYRILQEALNNVARHSGSKHATVRVHYAPDLLRLEIEDNGKGLATRSLQDRTGLGMIGMRERAELVHGRLRLENRPQGGARVSLEIPITHDS